MSALKFGELPPGLKSWNELYEQPAEPAVANTRWVRVDGVIEVRVTVDQVLEVEADASDADIIEAALGLQGVDLNVVGPDSYVDTDYFGITIDAATGKEIARRGVSL
jgi:hypothetical protein